MSVSLVGILNITPDSFSDGGRFDSAAAAITAGEKLIEQGADWLDIGGDSTRPGSVCVGPEEEWRRIGPVVTELAPRFSVSVDTHHAAVAEQALAVGAQMINDVSAGHDPQMFSVVASNNAKIVLMYSRCPRPHEFGPAPAGDVISAIRIFFENRIDAALRAGVRREQLILDSGFGAFLSEDPKVSFEVAERYGELAEFGLPLMIGVSRKGFLKRAGELSPTDRDPASAQLAADIVKRLPVNQSVLVRSHSIR